jgi:hypothetical protein
MVDVVGCAGLGCVMAHCPFFWREATCVSGVFQGLWLTKYLDLSALSGPAPLPTAELPKEVVVVIPCPELQGARRPLPRQGRPRQPLADEDRHPPPAHPAHRGDHHRVHRLRRDPRGNSPSSSVRTSPSSAPKTAHPRRPPRATRTPTPRRSPTRSSTSVPAGRTARDRQRRLNSSGSSAEAPGPTTDPVQRADYFSPIAPCHGHKSTHFLLASLRKMAIAIDRLRVGGYD